MINAICLTEERNADINKIRQSSKRFVDTAKEQIVDNFIGVKLVFVDYLKNTPPGFREQDIKHWTAMMNENRADLPKFSKRTSVEVLSNWLWPPTSRQPK
jgi:hypothetical protein